MPNSKLREKKKKKILLQTPPRHNLFTHRHPCHLALFFTLFLSLSHLSPFHLPLTSSSPTLPPPPSRLFISLNSLSPMGFSTLCLFISYKVFPHLFTSLIDCILNLLFKLSTTHWPNNWWCCLRIFFYPLCFYGGLCMKYAIFFPFLLFDSICGFCGMCYY